MIAETSTKVPSKAEIEDGLRAFYEPGEVFEIRILDVDGRNRTDSGYFNDPGIAAAAIVEHARAHSAIGVYRTLNSPKGELFARAANRIQHYAKNTTSDTAIERRRYLFIDSDSVHESGISATDQEKEHAWQVAETARTELLNRGWPEPIEQDSGNGRYLLYRIDEPNDESTTVLVANVLRALNQKFSTDSAKIDTTSANAARIIRVPGTLNAKGDNVADRPHRFSKLDFVPEEIGVVTREQLEALAAEYVAPVDNSPTKASTYNGQNHRLDIDRYLREAGFEFKVAKRDAKGREVREIDCPFNPDHKADAVVTQDDAGKLGFKCHHNSCAGKGWQDFKRVVGEPKDDQFNPPKVRSERSPSATKSQIKESDDPIGRGREERAFDQRGDFDDEERGVGMTPAGHFDSRLIRNANVTGEGKDKVTEPFSMEGITGPIRKHTGDFPRRVGDALFVQEGDQIQWLSQPAALFGWLGFKLKTPPKFYSSVGCHSREEVFAELRRTATAYKAIETLPHEPPMRDHFYTCKFPPIGTGSKLEKLLDRFSPETDVDRQLLKLLIVTRFWGGDGVIRPCPAFVLTSPDGRGAGKTKTAQLIAELGGGFMSFALHEKIDDMLKRLLSPEGLKKSFALLDNVKNRDVSWADLEALITASELSGKAMYIGEMQRPNNLVWVLTLNGVGLSTDMAQRCAIISLSKPQYSGTWEEDTRRFIAENRMELISDVIGFLRSPKKELTRYSRWGMWEREVLSRLPDPVAAQALILERQNVADVGREESEVIQEHIREQLQNLGYWTDRERILIPSSVLCRWVNWATGEKLTVVSASRMIRQSIDEGKLPLLQESKSRTHGRGVLWVGEEWDCESELRTDVEYKIRERSSGGFDRA